MTDDRLNAVRELHGALVAMRPAERLTLAELARTRVDQPGNAGVLWGLVYVAASEKSTPREVCQALAELKMSVRERVAHLAFIARTEFAKISAPGYAAVLSAIAEAALAASAVEDELLRSALPDEPQAVFVPEEAQFLDCGDDGPIAAS